ncbi:MAG TPA: N,N-dimethylformamidase beta subunit family domain-containing protein, partial [Candidatus Eisenbacteria bacterium]|nr:N,N-dimethylformamidase beta subunit family domain-containing protein [Candidatus Eisenbacteria bacterium]
MAFEGYTSAVSVRPGERIDFHMNSDAPADFAVQFRRVSRAGAVQLTGNGHVDPQPPAAANAHEAGVDWPSAFSLQVPHDWVSGIYRAQFAAGANQTSVSFIVRPAQPASTSSILLEAVTATEQAYNSWGGGNIYPSPGSPGAGSRSRRVSLDHPVVIGPQTYDREEKFLQWMDDRGLVAEVCSGIDLHSGLIPLDRYALLLSVSHDEYWSKEMRDAVEEFIAGGGNVAFFSGNTCWWQVRFEDADRTMVCFKSAAEDPLTGVDDARV